jgi:hypothetical protein
MVHYVFCLRKLPTPRKLHEALSECAADFVGSRVSGRNAKQRFKTVLAGGLLGLPLFGAAFAGPLEDSRAAFGRHDYATAARLLQPLAEHGNSGAQFDLGYLYENGYGVRLNYSSAATWYRKAADQGEVGAQERLGVMYEDGRGVPQDYVLAHMWLNLAASRFTIDTGPMSSHEEAVNARDKLTAKMTPDQIAEAQRMAREWLQKCGIVEMGCWHPVRAP